MNLIARVIGTVYDLSPLILENHLQPISCHRLFLYPVSLKTGVKNKCFLVFSGGIERDQWREMG